MRYVLTNPGSDIPASTKYSFCSKQDVIDFLEANELISLDIETTGFCPHQKDVLCIQVGNPIDQYLVDARIPDLLFLKPYLESKQLLGQNLKFDLKFLYKLGIYPNKVWDTFIAERVLYCGIKFHKASLDALATRYLGVTLDKSVRGDISKERLSERVIEYSLKDVEYLEPIYYKQMEQIVLNDLVGALNIENRFIPCLAYIEFCGFKLDKAKWKDKVHKDLQLMQDAEQALNEYILNRGISKFISTQLDMFEPVGCTVSWSSPQQVVRLFEHLGMDCSVTEKGVTKKSVEASVIKKFENTHPIVKLYLEYKKAEKVVTTYGESFLRQINPVTDRLHTNFTQIMDTSRLSSGGKDKLTQEEYPNFQNIPSDKLTRSCFVAEEGNTLIISDYSGQEQIVLANRALDKNLLAFYDNGLADMHSFVASKMYPELEGLTLDEVKDLHKEKRQAAKSAGFAINYGGQGITIADNLGISLEDGNKIYKAYFDAFPGLEAYFKSVKQQGLRDGYILINNITRRKTYLPFYEEFRELSAELNQEFWERYKLDKANNSISPVDKDKISRYFRYKGEIERKSLNYPIQGTSAEITKISGVKIFDYILEHNLFGIVKFVNTVHDENVLECPIHMQEEISKMVEVAMCDAGKIFCKRVPLKADPELSLFWKK